MPRRQLQIAAAAVLVFAAGSAAAQVPHAFAAGERASAAHVNENFQYLWDRAGGRLHVHKYEPDCPTVATEGYHYCAMASTGAAYDAAAPYTKVATATVPDGAYFVVGTVGFWTPTDALNAWWVLQCRMVDESSGIELGYADWSGASTVDAYGLPQGAAVYVRTNLHSPLTMMAALDLATGAGGKISVSCRLQGQAQRRNQDGSTTWPVPVTDVRLTSVKISAVQVAKNVYQASGE